MEVILIILFLPAFWFITRWIGRAESGEGEVLRFIVGVLVLLGLFGVLAMGF